MASQPRTCTCARSTLTWTWSTPRYRSSPRASTSGGSGTSAGCSPRASTAPTATASLGAPWIPTRSSSRRTSLSAGPKSTSGPAGAGSWSPSSGPWKAISSLALGASGERRSPWRRRAVTSSATPSRWALTVGSSFKSGWMATRSGCCTRACPRGRGCRRWRGRTTAWMAVRALGSSMGAAALQRCLRPRWREERRRPTATRSSHPAVPGFGWAGLETGTASAFPLLGSGGVLIGRGWNGPTPLPCLRRHCLEDTT
mmetsp:Transcript_41234/g.104974  ORF Transcript_41234/g.104974 Transcript_41234/m.104974 type:complete len:256 (+) Transcript_41234:1155-1922(+)